MLTDNTYCLIIRLHKLYKTRLLLRVELNLLLFSYFPIINLNIILILSRSVLTIFLK